MQVTEKSLLLSFENQVVLRKATIEDVPVICQLVRELREHHGRDGTPINEEKFKKYCFNDKTTTHIELAEVESKIVGLAIINFNFAAFQGDMEIRLEDFYVQEPYQKNGIGMALVRKIAQIGVENECCRVAGEVSNENSKAIEFYINLGAKQFTNLGIIRLDKQNMQKLVGSKDPSEIS